MERFIGESQERRTAWKIQFKIQYGEIYSIYTT